jgi:LDH2 family malate/lactate/ureidoglycolate dehydrogenase
VPKADAELASWVLDCADERGHPSHGIQRLDAYYGKLKAGEINPQPNPRFVSGGPDSGYNAGTFDGDNGLGLVIGPKANQFCMDMAESGVGAVAVRNSNHFGTAAYYVLEPMQRGFIGHAMTNTTPLTVPFGGRERFFGTDAIAYGFPGHTERGLVSDFATSVAAVGKMELCIRAGRPIPDCWALDENGQPTTDPIAGRKGGLRPAGADRDHAGHKGTCLATIVQSFCGLLSGAAWGPFTPRFTVALGNPPAPPQGVVGVGTGHMFGAWKIEAFRDLTEFGQQVDLFIEKYMQVPPSLDPSEELAYPGLVEWRNSQQHETHVPVLQQIVDSLVDMSKQTGVPLGPSESVYDEEIEEE